MFLDIAGIDSETFVGLANASDKDRKASLKGLVIKNATKVVTPDVTRHIEPMLWYDTTLTLHSAEQD
jgi:hypothetical protein